MCSCRYLAGLYNCSVPRHRFHSTPVSLPLRTPYPSRLVNMSSPWRGEAGKPGKASKASKTEKGAKLKSKTPRRADREPAAAAAGPSPRDAASLCATASRCQGCVVVLSKLAQCRTRLQTAGHHHQQHVNIVPWVTVTGVVHLSLYILLDRVVSCFLNPNTYPSLSLALYTLLKRTHLCA